MESEWHPHSVPPKLSLLWDFLIASSSRACDAFSFRPEPWATDAGTMHCRCRQSRRHAPTAARGGRGLQRPRTNPEEQSGVTLADAFTSLRERQALASLHLFLMHNVQGMLQRQNIHEGDITVVLRPVWNMGKMSCSCVFSIKLNWFLKFLHDSREILTFQTDLECYFLINLRLTCLSGFVPSVLFTAYIIANISVLRDGIFILRHLF